MSTHDLKTLITKLNDQGRRAAERAAALCMSRGHYEVELEHLLLALLEPANGDLSVLCRRFDVSPSALQADLEAELAALRTGNTRTPVFGLHVPDLLEQAWLIASLDTHHPRIRGGHLLLALLSNTALYQVAMRSSPLFARFRREEIRHRLAELTQDSEEAPAIAAGGPPAGLPGMPNDTPGQPAGTPALDQFTTNLTRQARDGRLDPVIGREAEIRQVVDILVRRRQNNPILTGEAGVGKTAVVEGLALRIAAGQVPEPLQGVELHTLDMGLLQAGASVKGEFESRLRNVIDEVKKSTHPIVLFIDEAHTLIGAGGQAGQNDAANLLKPALARGELRTIAATTWSEYKRYFEKDAALARRFQVVKVDEPSEAVAAAMLRGMASLMEAHFKVRVLDDAITEAVRLSARYISGRQLPDKAVSVLDTACAKVALGQSAVPAAMDDKIQALQRLDTEIAAVQREARAGAPVGDRLDDLHARRAAWQGELDVLQQRHQAERVLAAEIQALRRRLEDPPDEVAEGQHGHLEALRRQLAAKLAELATLQGRSAMVPLQVDANVIAEVVSAWTGVPLGKMVKDEIDTVLRLPALLRQRVIGQDHALEAIAQRVRTSRASLEDPHKPQGVFLFVGPSGVGKTETALALADILHGGERNLVTINMSEYQEAHSVSGLKGSPPGYVGYGEGGVLTEAVRRQPYSVVLLDEVEKAHPEVLEMFFQIFDKGVMDDAEGREVDFRNTLIILTSNIGSAQVMQACLDKRPADLPQPGDLEAMLRPALYKAFKPAFLGRLKVIPYYALGDDVLERVIRLKLDRIGARVKAHHRAAFDYDGKLVDAVFARCTEVDTGARNVDHILNGTLLPEIAEQVLARMAQGRGIDRIKVTATRQGDFKYAVT